MLKNYVERNNLYSNLPNLAFHTMNLCDNLIIIYGGIFSKTEINGNFYLIETQGNKFQRILYSKNKEKFPVPRFYHSANWDIKRKKLYIFGGYNFDKDVLYLQDLNVVTFNKSNGSEEFDIEIKTFKLKIPNRCKHTSFIHKNFLYLFGGEGFENFIDKKEIKNDFYKINLDTYITTDVAYKGGNELSILIPNCIKISEDEFAFFTNDFTYFFLFDPETDTFTKVQMDLLYPIEPRENFTLNSSSNNKIILFGGKNHEKIFSDAYLLLSYQIEKKINFTWNRIDLNGFVYEGYSGHSSISFGSGMILIFGGILNYIDPIQQKSYTTDPRINNRLQLFEYNNLVCWNITERIKTIIVKGNAIDSGLNSVNYITKQMFKARITKMIEEKNKRKKSKKKDNLPQEKTEDQIVSMYEEDKIKIGLHLNRIGHIGFILKGEIENNRNYLILHGGETFGKILSDLQFFDLSAEKWINPNKFKNELESFPQVKNHSWSYFSFSDKEKKKEDKKRKENLKSINNEKSLFVEYLYTQNIKNKEFIIENLENSINEVKENEENEKNNTQISNIKNNIANNPDNSELFFLNTKSIQQTKTKNFQKDRNFDFKQDEEEFLEEYIIFCGGITINHTCKRSAVQEFKNDLKSQINKIQNEINNRSNMLTNEEKYICNCDEETISDRFYLYKMRKFHDIIVHKDKIDDSINSDLLRRFGHNLVYVPSLDRIFLLCGYVQFKGFVFDMIQIKLIYDKKNKTRPYSCSLIKIEELDSIIPGRIFGTCCVFNRYLILFGGVSQKNTLDDIWVINLDDKLLNYKHNMDSEEENGVYLNNNAERLHEKAKVSARRVENLYGKFNPRYGCASVIYRSNILDINEKKILIFGGSVYYSENNKYDGLINEVLILKVNENLNNLQLELYAPAVNGIVEKGFFNVGNFYKSKIYFTGGINNDIFSMNLPTFKLSDICLEFDLFEIDHKYEMNTYRKWFYHKDSISNKNDDKFSHQENNYNNILLVKDNPIDEKYNSQSPKKVIEKQIKHKEIDLEISNSKIPKKNNKIKNDTLKENNIHLIKIEKNIDEFDNSARSKDRFIEDTAKKLDDKKIGLNDNLIVEDILKKQKGLKNFNIDFDFEFNEVDELKKNTSITKTMNRDLNKTDNSSFNLLNYNQKYTQKELNLNNNDMNVSKNTQNNLIMNRIEQQSNTKSFNPSTNSFARKVKKKIRSNWDDDYL